MLFPDDHDSIQYNIHTYRLYPCHKSLFLCIIVNSLFLLSEPKLTQKRNTTYTSSYSSLRRNLVVQKVNLLLLLLMLYLIVSFISDIFRFLIVIYDNKKMLFFFLITETEKQWFILGQAKKKYITKHTWFFFVKYCGPER